MNDVLLPIILALIAATPGVVAFIAGRRKTNAEITSIEVATLRSTLEEVRKDAEAAHREADEAKAVANKAQADLKILSIAFDKLQQNFLESERAKELLQAAVVERDRIIDGLRRRVGELEKQIGELMTTKT